MAEKAFAPHLELEVNTAVIIKPWTVRAVKTEHGTKWMLGIREGGKDLELPWLPLDAMEQLVALKVCTRGTWPDGNPKFTVVKGAPDIAVCKRQKAGEKYPHIEFALPGEDDGPEMPEEVVAPKAPTPTPRVPAVAVPYEAEAARITKQLAVGLGIENFDDPLVAAAALECAEKLYVTLRIEGQR